MLESNCHYLSNWTSCDTAQRTLPSKDQRHIFGSSKKGIFFFPSFEHKSHFLRIFDFSVSGTTFLRKCLSVSCGNVLSDPYRPGKLCFTAARANFVNRHSTSRILYESCCIFLSITCRKTTNELRTAEFISVLKSFRYYWVSFFSFRPCTFAATSPSNPLPPFYDYNQPRTKAPLFPCLLETLCLFVLWYIDTMVTFHLSSNFSTLTGLEYLAMISPFSSFLSFTSLGTFFLFSFSVPSQSVQFSKFSFFANSGLLKKFSIHSLCPRPNKGTKSSNTTAAILRLLELCRQFQCHYS